MKEHRLVGNQEGSVLVVALIMLVLLTILGVAASRTSTVEIQIAGNDNLHKRSFYAAEAGIEHVKARLADRFAVVNGPRIAMGLSPDWDFALMGPDGVSGTADDVKDTDADGIGSFDDGSEWLTNIQLGKFTYTVTVWNNNDAGDFQNDTDALIWALSTATGPGGATSTIQVSLLGTASGGTISNYTGQAGGGEGKSHTSDDVNAMTSADLGTQQL